MPNIGPAELLILGIFLLLLIAGIAAVVMLVRYLRSQTRKNNAIADQLSQGQHDQRDQQSQQHQQNPRP